MRGDYDPVKADHIRLIRLNRALHKLLPPGFVMVRVKDFDFGHYVGAAVQDAQGRRHGIRWRADDAVPTVQTVIMDFCRWREGVLMAALRRVTDGA